MPSIQNDFAKECDLMEEQEDEVLIVDTRISYRRIIIQAGQILFRFIQNLFRFIQNFINDKSSFFFLNYYFVFFLDLAIPFLYHASLRRYFVTFSCR